MSEAAIPIAFRGGIGNHSSANQEPASPKAHLHTDHVEGLGPSTADRADGVHRHLFEAPADGPLLITAEPACG